MGKQKILYVHHAGGFGGAPKSMGYIIKDLDRNKYIPSLLNIEEGPINEFFKNQGIELFKMKGARPFHGSTVVEKSFMLLIRNYLYLIPSIIRAYFFIKKHKPKLIHLNSTCLFAFAMAAKLNNVKVICHVREPLREGFWGAPIRFFCKKYVDGFIAICKNDLNSLRLKTKAKNKAVVIYNFVDEIGFKQKTKSLKNELGLKVNDIVFLYLARFAKSNGWEELIKEAIKISSKKKNFHFVLAGATQEYELNYSKNKNIHILPFRKNVKELLTGADVFICPFTEPHFARGVIEASALGLPIIGANIGGVNELIKNNKTGFLYNNFSELENAIVKLGGDKQIRIEMGNEGVSFAFESFNHKKNLKETYSFYNEII